MSDSAHLELVKSVTVAEVAHASEMQEDLKRKLSEATKAEAARVNTIRSAVLGMVVSESYDRAKDDLHRFVEVRAAFPNFQDRVVRHVQHCGDLIEAIKTKRNFPGLATLSLSKQHELHEKVLEHFEELKQSLRYIERAERDHKLEDVRSTVWVLKAASLTVGMIVAAMAIADLRSGLFTSSFSMVETLLEEASTWVVSHIPFI